MVVVGGTVVVGATVVVVGGTVVVVVVVVEVVVVGATVVVVVGAIVVVVGGTVVVVVVVVEVVAVGATFAGVRVPVCVGAIWTGAAGAVLTLLGGGTSHPAATTRAATTADTICTRSLRLIRETLICDSFDGWTD